MITRKDLLTGEQFLGRINQNFKAPQNRIKFYNDKANRIRHAKRDYDIRLHKNFILLDKLLGENKSSKFHIEFLKGNGYTFNIYTHLVKFENVERYAIYNFVILPEGETHVKIIRL